MGRGICTFAATLALVVALVACGDDESSQEDAAVTTACTSSPEPPRVTYTYEVEDPGGAVDAEGLSEILCERLTSLEVNADVTVEGDELKIVYAGEPPPDVESAVADQSSLFFYDLEPNVVPLENGVRVGEVTPNNLTAQTTTSQYTAVERASRQPPRPCAELCASEAPSFYLFEKRSRAYVAGPEASEEVLLELPQAKALREDKRRIFEVPVGTVVVEDQPETDSEGNAVEGAPIRYFVLNDDPALSGEDIVDPEQDFDLNNQPNVVFFFTDEGRVAFQEITRDIAQRGLESGAGVPYSFAIAIDGQILSRPIIDFDENPDGIDGVNGAQISGSFTVEEAEQLAEFLSIGRLPTPLRLVEVETEG